MNQFPLIGISGSINMEETQHYVLRDYLRSVIAGGGMPVLLSPDMDGEMLSACISRLDGLLLAGGNDIDPAVFHELPLQGLGEVNPLRDLFEVALLREAIRCRMPVLGICRGVQVMNAALGGTLWQDLPSQYVAGDGVRLILHRQTAPDRYPSHPVSIIRDSKLGEVVCTDELRVNSFHHQAIRRPAPGLRITAFAPDGIVEAVEHTSLPFFLGVQWHPERYINTEPAALALFSALANAARLYACQKAED